MLSSANSPDIAAAKAMLRLQDRPSEVPQITEAGKSLRLDLCRLSPRYLSNFSSLLEARLQANSNRPRIREAAAIAVNQLNTTNSLKTQRLLYSVLNDALRHHDRHLELFCYFELSTEYALGREWHKAAEPAFNKAFAELDIFVAEKQYLKRKRNSVFDFVAIGNGREGARAAVMSVFLPYVEVALDLLAKNHRWDQLQTRIDWTRTKLQTEISGPLVQSSWCAELNTALSRYERNCATRNCFSRPQTYLSMLREVSTLQSEGKFEKSAELLCSLQEGLEFSIGKIRKAAESDRPLLMHIMYRRMHDAFLYAENSGLNSLESKRKALQTCALFHDAVKLIGQWQDILPARSIRTFSRLAEGGRGPLAATERRGPGQ